VNNHAQLLRELLDSPRIYPPGSEEFKQAAWLTKKGFLVHDPSGEFDFPSPLHMHYYMMHASTAQVQTIKDCSNDFREFLVQVRQRRNY
jgi:hypothetical protein